MKYFYILFFLFIQIKNGLAQNHVNLNGLYSSVINTPNISVEPRRYEILNLSYNSHHWQQGGIVIIELFEYYYGLGYEKYILEVGFGQGANFGLPLLKKIESHGNYHLAKLTLGTPSDLSSYEGGFINKYVPVFLDVKEYGGYKVKLTYMQNKVEQLINRNEIKVFENPVGTIISGFDIPLVDYTIEGLLKMSGDGTHFISNGKLGIGTKTPDERLSVKGKIHAEEVKVDLNVPGPDYVFAKDYKLKSLQEVEDYILKYKHLPEIPTALEMEKNGINLSEMNMLLLKKIEELTLHLIELKKQVDSK